VISQRGLSGIKSNPNKNPSDGIAATANIHRQLLSPRRAICQLTRYAESMPTTIANWFKETSVPRFFEGEISAI
jgi:hypothetical protein